MMNKIIKSTIVILLISACFKQISFAYTLDTSVDKEIKKTYNSSKLSDEVLPALPKNLEQNPSSSKNSQPATTVTPTINNKTINVTPAINNNSLQVNSGIFIPKRTKFQVTSNVKINDWLKNGSSVSFTSYAPVYKKYVSIPVGTKFMGIITDIHRPQIAGNGGLIEIKITSMNYNGRTIPINGKVTKANGKKIFFNNIKGERGYINGVKTQYAKGEKFYQKTRNTSSKMSTNPIGTVLSPIPTITGAAGYAVMTVISPITGLSGKGKDISIPQGSVFEIKLLEDAPL